MTSSDFTKLLKHPQTVKPTDAQHLRELTDVYPYFAPARMLHLRALQRANSIHFENALNQAALYAHDRRWLYYFIYPEKKSEEKKYIRAEKNTGDYFGMLDAVEQEGKDVGQSLKMLAERLRKARLDIAAEEKTEQRTKNKEQKNQKNIFEPKKIKSDENCSILHDVTLENYPEKLKILMHEQKYEPALEILTHLNLNNPKKSRYFADQIRFLEKVIENKNK